MFVASFAVVEEKSTGRLASVAVWTRTVPTLLPRADFIAFVDVIGTGDDDTRLLGFVPWDGVRALVPAALTPDGRNPARWATSEAWPTMAELATLAPWPDVFP